MNLKETCKAIKTLKIQGAENITTSAIKSLNHTIQNSKAKNKKQLQKELKTALSQLFTTRPTEPEMRNYCNLFLSFLNTYQESNLSLIKHTLKEYAKIMLRKREERKERFIEIGNIFLTKRKEKELIIYTHCHSSTVTSIIKKANKNRKIKVINTETRPLFQGRKTAKELSKVKIKVDHYIDSAMILAIKNSDIILIGADAITHQGVYNKIGSELLGHLASYFHKPLYVCASLWKYDEHSEIIEERSEKEVWKQKPKNVKVHNPAFEKVHFKHIKRIICEEGILRPKKFLKKAKARI